MLIYIGSSHYYQPAFLFEKNKIWYHSFSLLSLKISAILYSDCQVFKGKSNEFCISEKLYRQN